jgi:hypothetical protein
MPVLLKREVFVSLVGWIVGVMCLVVAHGGVWGVYVPLTRRKYCMLDVEVRVWR